MESMLPSIVGTLPLGLAVVDTAGRIRSVNGYLRERLGLVEGDAEGRYFHEIFRGIDEGMLQGVLELCQDVVPLNYGVEGCLNEFDIRADRGYGYSARLRCALCFPFTGPSNESLRAVVFYEAVPEEAGNEFHVGFSRALKAVRDAHAKQHQLLIEVQRAQDRLVRSEKLAGIGQLAAGVAHEINNPLGYVFSNLRSLSGYVQDLLRIIDAVDVAKSLEEILSLKQTLDYDFIRNDVKALVDESAEGVERVKTIINALQDFSRTDAGKFRYADLHQGIDTTLNVAAGELKYKAEVVKEYGSIPQVQCNISQINQVVLNLILNASHALSEKGMITIRTGSSANEAWFEIEDTGCGIAPDQVEKIFDPFFTSKTTGVGTGLGLSVSYGIVQQHKGRIEVRSKVGEGSCFRVVLPIAQPVDAEDEEVKH